MIVISFGLLPMLPFSFFPPLLFLALLNFSHLSFHSPYADALARVILFLLNSAFFKAVLFSSCPLLVRSISVFHLGNSK